MDVLTRYPDAETVEDAIKMHTQSLKSTVEAKWREVEAAEAELSAFVVATGGQPAPVQVKADAAPAVHVALPTVQSFVYSPRLRESRIRADTNDREYCYGSNQYIEAASRLKIGNYEQGRRLWLTAPEVQTIRSVLAQKDAERLESQRAGHVARRVSLNRSRISRVRKGTTIMEHKYRSSEYATLAYTERFGTLDNEWVWLTDEELGRVRAVVRDRHDSRTRAKLATGGRART
jgi:hypothetical protein